MYVHKHEYIHIHVHVCTLLMFSDGRFLTTPTAFTTMSLLRPSNTSCHSCTHECTCHLHNHMYVYTTSTVQNGPLYTM